VTSIRRWLTLVAGRILVYFNQAFKLPVWLLGILARVFLT